MKNRVVFTGIGLVTSLGDNSDEIWNKLLQGKSGAQSWNDLSDLGFPSTVACRIPDIKHDDYDRGRQITLKAVSSAIRQAGVNFEGKKVGIFLGSTIGESAAFEKVGEGEQVTPDALSLNYFSESIKSTFGISGITRNYGTACAAGNYAIGAAITELRNESIQVAIAGGIDPFSKIAMIGFQRSRAMSNDGVCRPFDKNRTGMLLGEGGAFFILEREEDALARKVMPLAVASNCGLSADAYHPTAPHPSGKGMETSMMKSLQYQKLTPDKIGWICAHGSATLLSDAAEATAIRNIFGNYAIPVSGFKGAFGHTLGAATAIEAAVCILSFQHNVIPATINFKEPDPTLLISLVEKPMEMRGDWILNCGYAFGGLNSALLIGRWN